MALSIQRKIKEEASSVLLHYGGSGLSARDASGPISMTGSGGLLYFPSNASVINQCFNPSFEVDTLGWSSGACTLVSSTDFADSGSRSGKVTITNVASTPFIFNTIPYRTPCFAGDVARFQFKVRGGPNSLGVPVRGQIRFYDAAGVVVGGTYIPATFVVSTDKWQLLNIGPTTAPANSVSFEYLVRFEVGGAYPNSSRYVQVGDVLYVDSALPTINGDGSGEYFDGSTKGVWANPITGALGTPHLSRSISSPSVLVQEATTNLLQNPSAETDASTGVLTIGATVTRDTNFYNDGVASFKCVTNNAATSEGFHLTSATLNRVNVTQTFPARVRVYGQSGTVGVFVRIQYTDASQTDGTTTALTLDGTLKDIVLNVPTSVNTKTIEYVALCFRTSTQQAATFWVDMAQVEDNKTFASAYTSGALGSGFTWSGTANLSSSTRAASNVTTPIANHVVPKEGSFVLWTNRKVDTASIQYMLQLGDYNVAGTDWLALAVNNANDQPTAFWKGGAGTQASIAKGTIATVDTWQLWYVEWDTTNVSISLNGGALSSVAKPSQHLNFGPNNIHVGSFGGSAQFNGLIYGVRIFDRKLSLAELTAMAAAPSEGTFFNFPISSLSLSRDA